MAEDKKKKSLVQSTATTKAPPVAPGEEYSSYVGRSKADAAAAGAEERDRQAGKLREAATKTSAEGMPKQEPGEDAASYGARIRKWREGQKAKNSNQSKALK